MSYRQLTAEEEKVEESVWSSWEAFLMQMQDAGEFINTQTPLMTQQLEETFEVSQQFLLMTFWRACLLLFFHSVSALSAIPV